MVFIIRYIMFPVYMFTSVAIGIYVVQNHHELMIPVNFTIMVFSAISIAIAEQVAPAHKDWNRNRKDFHVDVLHFFVSMLGIPEILNVLILGMIYPGAASLASQYGLQVWPHHWPMWLQLFLAVLLADFGFYATHRISHEVDFFWRFHSIHHSSNRMYWVNAARDHPLSTIFVYSFEAFPMVFLGASQDIFALFLLVMVVQGLFQHSNVDYRLGFFNNFFELGEVHRWHHVQNEYLHRKNYAKYFSIFDWLAGSFYYSKRIRVPDKIGVIEFQDFPQNYGGQLRVPFIWKKMPRKKESKNPRSMAWKG